MTYVLWTIVAVIVVICIYAFVTFNHLVKLQDNIRVELTTYEAYLDQRWDFISNVIDVIGGYMEREKKVLEQIQQQRVREYGSLSFEARTHADNQLSTGLAAVMGAAEQYDVLKNSERYIKLKDQLNALEWNIASSKTNYDNARREFARQKNQIPKCFIAKIFHVNKSFI